ncbi:hypothetical protein GCM10010918_13100 [Paenibacillus radicis (ex Gao et al. 2016)]|uniref:Uncharacterized protein n=1 Tax=Paenibacillus radicis (ex Gao et al. 2016) TaxID=1737354 RepID=A0A917GYB6_9BACL|nr:hypothetical protein GCM10010918_13100 [Paenibacillus radicis (ex Gao et al. 2016)]
MWLLVGIISVWLWSGFKDIPELIRKQQRGALLLHLLLMAVFTAGSLAYMYMNNPPNPLKWIESAISPYSKAIYSLLS